MTHQTTVTGTDSGPLSALIPGQRAAVVTALPGAGTERTGGLRRTLAVLRGLRSMATVPAAPRISYGESDGQ